jgi:hypothetical protein
MTAFLERRLWIYAEVSAFSEEGNKIPARDGHSSASGAAYPGSAAAALGA